MHNQLSRGIVSRKLNHAATTDPSSRFRRTEWGKQPPRPRDAIDNSGVSAASPIALEPINRRSPLGHIADSGQAAIVGEADSKPNGLCADLSSDDGFGNTVKHAEL